MRAGDEDAWETLWLAYFPRLTRYAATLLREETEAEDIASEALLRVLTRFATSHAPRSFSGYLFVVARNLVTDLVRDRIRHREAADRHSAHASHDARQPEAELLRQTRERAVVEALHAIPPRQRDVLISLFVHDRPVAEIADELGLTRNATNQLAFRARRSLLAALAASEQRGSDRSQAPGP